jgi:cytochrome P450
MTVSHASNFRWRDGSMGDLIPLLGDGLLTTDGDYHKRARRLMLPAFHREQLAASKAIMDEEADRALDRWRVGDELDLYASTRQLALRIAMRALFGFSPDARARDAELADVFEHTLGYWGKDYVLQMLRGPGSPWRAMNRTKAELDRVIFAEIARRRASGERGLDILSLLLDAEDEDGAKLSDQELRDQVMTLLFAGHDTATSTVTFLFYELARNPHEIAPAAASDERLEMAIDETLRMYPPAWIGPRRSVEPFDLHGVSVPGGVFVNYCSWASHHLESVFPSPEQFRPERFTPEARAELPKGAYVPFGGGSRTCIGMRFGQMEVQAIARAILDRYRLDLASPGHEVSIRQMPTLSPRGGLPVVVRAAA